MSDDEQLGDVSEDESKQTQKKMQSLTDDFVDQIDAAMRQKEQEILTI